MLIIQTMIDACIIRYTIKEEDTTRSHDECTHITPSGSGQIIHILDGESGTEVASLLTPNQSNVVISGLHLAVGLMRSTLIGKDNPMAFVSPEDN
jgi:hypothetical protein